eukprot:gene1494-4652_t
MSKEELYMEIDEDEDGDISSDINFQNILKQLKPKSDDLPKKKKKIEALCNTQAAALVEQLETTFAQLQDKMKEVGDADALSEVRRLLQDDGKRWVSVITSTQDVISQYESAVKQIKRTHDEQIKQQEAIFMEALEDIAKSYQQYKIKIKDELDNFRASMKQQVVSSFSAM